MIENLIKQKMEEAKKLEELQEELGTIRNNKYFKSMEWFNKFEDRVKEIAEEIKTRFEIERDLGD
jgi:hypothetical protein